MDDIRGVVVSVNYGDLLAITLPRIMPHLSECVVVTTHADEQTKAVARSIQGTRISETDAFTRHGARFNKGLALEEAGFDVLGRRGWILVWDADCIFPEYLPVEELEVGNLYSAPRRIVDDYPAWARGESECLYKLHQEVGFPGYFHLFNAEDSHLQPAPWYDVTYSHAGGGDGFFQSRWPKGKKIHLPCEVFHLGPVDTNWFGRASARLDGVAPDSEAAALMSEYKRGKGWIRGRKPKIPIQDRVQVPGHEPRKWIHASQDV